jgi:hypothetical protein
VTDSRYGTRQASATAANSSWILGNVEPGVTGGCNYVDC